MGIKEESKVIFEPEKIESRLYLYLTGYTKELFIDIYPNVALSGLLFEREENELMINFQGNVRNLQNF